MPPVNFLVSQSQVISDAFRKLMDQAQTEGRLTLVLRASRYLLDELAYDPLRWGEPREHLVHANLQMRIAFAGPIYVEFAVHEPNRITFIRRFALFPLR